LFAEGKTDYAQRKGLVVQDKNKYQIPKHRLVARLTNRYVIAQIVRTGAKGDETICAANSAELTRYGLTVGLKNYPACYATGLLLARRLLASLTQTVTDEAGKSRKGNLGEAYKGQVEVTGDVVSFEADEAEHAGQRKKATYWIAEGDYYAEMDRFDYDEHVRRPFRAYLDVGVKATTPGARIFGILKGAVDGGLDIPHNNKNFPGYNKNAEEDDEKWEPEEHRRRIMGETVGEFITLVADGALGASEGVKARNPQQFSAFKAAGLDETSYPALLAKVHAAIRKDPSPAAKKEFKVTTDLKKKLKKTAKKNGDVRRAEVAARWASYQTNLSASKAARVQELLAQVGGDDSESDEE
jgi:large subunit ribosomal protein L5e